MLEKTVTNSRVHQESLKLASTVGFLSILLTVDVSFVTLYERVGLVSHCVIFRSLLVSNVTRVRDDPVP